VTATYQNRFFAAMDDDFNTAEALAVLFDLVREINRLRDTDLTQAAQLGQQLRHLGGILGLLQTEPAQFLQTSGGEATADGLTAVQIEQLIADRKAARQNKQWAEADRIRDELKAQGVVLEDGAQGTTWRRE
jgi:cysteinyl-tRNA synthetase